MIRPIVRDLFFLSLPSEKAGQDDLAIAEDLADTLIFHQDRCAGMAANMIGYSKRIIAVVRGPEVIIMLNPRILAGYGEYETDEGCLSLDGTRKVKRYRSIRITWQDKDMKEHAETLTGFQAQAVQHEMDHCEGILI